MKNTILTIILLISLNTSLSAKDIYVKYKGIVDVDNGHFSELKLKKSSLIKSMYYDKENKYLLVQLKKTYYHYCAIPNNVVSNWGASQSLGKYYNAYIRGNYDCRLYPQPSY